MEHCRPLPIVLIVVPLLPRLACRSLLSFSLVFPKCLFHSSLSLMTPNDRPLWSERRHRHKNYFLPLPRLLLCLNWISLDSLSKLVFLWLELVIATIRELQFTNTTSLDNVFPREKNKKKEEKKEEINEHTKSSKIHEFREKRNSESLEKNVSIFTDS